MTVKSGKIKYYLNPSVTGESYHEAQVLGNSIWVWMNSEAHSTATLNVLKSQLLPALKLNQYILGFDENDMPAFFMSWANLDAETETRYITEGAKVLTPDKWNCGDRKWYTYFLTSSGDGAEVVKELIDTILSMDIACSLHHHGKRTGVRVISWRGKDITKEQYEKWVSEHPLFVDVPIINMKRK